MLRNLSLICLVAVSFVLVACNDDDGATPADTAQRKATAAAAAEAQAQVGFPRIPNFTERKNARMILELRDDAELQCYAYLYVPMTGELKFYGRCMGYGLPYSTQFTNPERVEEVEVHGTPNVAVTVPQPDPNQLFMPTSSSATWLMMVGPDGKIGVDYVEPQIIVSQFKRH